MKPVGGTSNGGRPAGAGSSSGGGGGLAGGGGVSGGGGVTSGGEAGAALGGAGGAGDVIATCLDAPVTPNTETQALRLTGDGLELGLVRYVGADSFNDLQFSLQRFALVRGDIAECVSDPARLHYTASHHNWDDEMSATAGDRTWVVTASSAADADWTIEARAGDAVAWGPIVLTIASCERMDAPGLVCNKTPIQ